MKNLKKQIQKFLGDESGQGTVEYILILVGIVGLAAAFRTQILDLIGPKMGKLATDILKF